jgi:hypothetical protein
MMRKLLFLAVGFGFMMCVGAATAQSHIQFAWGSNGNPSWVNCSASTPPATSACLGPNYSLTDITNASNPVVVANPSITALSFSLPLPSAGSHTYTLVINAKAFDGSTVASPPATVTVVVPAVLPALVAPTGPLTATPQ